MITSPQTVTLPAGHTLAVTADAVSSGNVYPFAQHVGDTAGVSPVAAGATVTLGPFATVTRYQIVPISGALTQVIASVDFPTSTEALADAAAAARLAHVPVVGNVGDVRDFIGAGVPAVTAQAALTVNPAGDDNGLIYTAVAYGPSGNDITVAYVDPAANNALLSVDVVGSAITVNLATGVAGAITSTAAQVKAAIEGFAPAAALVTVAIMTADTGIADNGSGIVTAMALANLVGGTGVGVDVAGIGSRYTDITNGKLYINGGTKAVPAWKIVTSA